jgi:hypothetical protein
MFLFGIGKKKTDIEESKLRPRPKEMRVIFWWSFPISGVGHLKPCAMMSTANQTFWDLWELNKNQIRTVGNRVDRVRQVGRCFFKLKDIQGVTVAEDPAEQSCD